MRKFFQTIIDAWKFIAAVGGIAGATLWMNAKLNAPIENQDAMFDSISDLKQQVEYINIEQGWMAEDILDLKDTFNKVDKNIRDIEKEMKVHHNSIDDLSWAIKNKENFTPEQLEEVLDRVLKKNDLTVSTDGE